MDSGWHTNFGWNMKYACSVGTCRMEEKLLLKEKRAKKRQRPHQGLSFDISSLPQSLPSPINYKNPVTKSSPDFRNFSSKFILISHAHSGLFPKGLTEHTHQRRSSNDSIFSAVHTWGCEILEKSTKWGKSTHVNQMLDFACSES